MPGTASSEVAGGKGSGPGIARLNRHAEGVDRDTLQADEMIRYAIIRQLEILGPIESMLADLTGP